MAGPGVEVRGAEEFKGQLEAFPDELRKARRKALLTGASIVEKFWKLRLSGPRGARRLGIVTGTLRRSVHRGRVSGDEVRIGTNQPYAAVHEYGFHGAVNVRAHIRSGVPVRSHTRQMMMPERPHMRPAMKDARRPVDLIWAGRLDDAIRLSKQRGERLKGAQRRLAGWGNA